MDERRMDGWCCADRSGSRGILLSRSGGAASRRPTTAPALDASLIWTPGRDPAPHSPRVVPSVPPPHVSAPPPCRCRPPPLSASDPWWPGRPAASSAELAITASRACRSPKVNASGVRARRVAAVLCARQSPSRRRLFAGHRVTENPTRSSAAAASRPPCRGARVRTYACVTSGGGGSSRDATEKDEDLRCEAV
ncbi:unnamed protein product [Urochloa decumbens]|uniref:Uncharacterized protein n=1 Tax=Urochloa decumbens TaxID=240449 RepID=A0ABC8WG13_9POAL